MDNSQTPHLALALTVASCRPQNSQSESLRTAYSTSFGSTTGPRRHLLLGPALLRTRVISACKDRCGVSAPEGEDLLMYGQYPVTGENGGQIDRYFTQIIQATWQMRSQHIITGTSIKHLRTLGDGTAVALLKSLSASELLKPDSIRVYLRLIKDSFASFQWIQIEENKIPRVTVFLLKSLEHYGGDVDLRNEIQQVTDYVKQQTNYNE